MSFQSLQSLQSLRPNFVCNEELDKLISKKPPHLITITETVVYSQTNSDKISPSVCFKFPDGANVKFIIDSKKIYEPKYYGKEVVDVQYIPDRFLQYEVHPLLKETKTFTKYEKAFEWAKTLSELHENYNQFCKIMNNSLLRK